MTRRPVNVLDMREDMRRMKYGIDYTEDMKTGWIYAVDNAVNVINVGEQQNYDTFKIVFPNYTACRGARRMRKFIV